MTLPNLVIAGVGKAGTTSLFWYLSQHPDICASDEKEIRYFAGLTEGGTELPPVETYERHFRHCRGERYAMEASPQYFHGGAPVIQAMRRLLGRPRVVISLRDPVERLWSQFRFTKSRLGPVPETLSFEAYVERSEHIWREQAPLTPETRPWWHLAGGVYADHIEPWLESFGGDLRVVFAEHLAEDPRAVVVDLARWLGIDEVCVRSFTFSIENRTELVRSRLLQRVALFLNRERLLGGRRRLKAPLRRAYYALNRRRTPETMDPATRRHLEELFAPHNARLASILRAHGYEDLPAWLRRDEGRSTLERGLGRHRLGPAERGGDRGQGEDRGGA
ncbi:MAG: hypothetical protein KatS3mg013_1023 [Actinomycetota bacterium]|nr:MAG: hypothetical protein KatS3mg013_1023 [Actinomycetota bacterium]